MNIIRGKSNPALRVLVYGPPGVGKSSFACGASYPSREPAPGVLALDYEHGLDAIGPARVEGPRDWEPALDLVREACAGPGDHTTVVIDTVDALADVASRAICARGVKGKKVDSLAEFGYGDGFEILAAHWRTLLHALESARAKGRAVILVAHVKRDSVDDPQVGRYAAWQAALPKLCWQETHRWCDDVLFANYEMAVADKTTRAFHTGSRWLYTIAGTGYAAKNRGELPAQIPLSWDAYQAARKLGTRSADEMIGAIRAIQYDAEKLPAMLAWAGNDVGKLMTLERKLKEKSA